MNDTILSVCGASKSYKSGSATLQILKNINLELQAGKSIAVIGASGSGKSTLLNLIGGLDDADCGEIESCGFQVNRLKEKELTAYRSQAIGFVFQFHYLLKDFTAAENVMLPMLMRGIPRKQAKARADETLEQVGIASRSGHYPAQLSGGERQRAALARSLINSPKLILADEPTGSLDEEHRSLVEDLIFSRIAEAGAALILVTHSGELAKKADRTMLLREGLLQSP